MLWDENYSRQNNKHVWPRKKSQFFTNSFSTNIMAPPAAPTANLKLDKKGMMDGIDDDDDDEEDEDDEGNVDKRGFGTGGPVADVNYSNPHNGRGGSKKVKIMKKNHGEPPAQQHHIPVSNPTPQQLSM